jgi:hypothetical protein
MFFFLLLELHYLDNHVSKFQTSYEVPASIIHKPTRHKLQIRGKTQMPEGSCRKQEHVENVLLANLLTHDARHIVVA